jgi:hypothetical protein
MPAEPTPHIPAAARTTMITRAPGPVSAQRPRRLAQPWRRVTSLIPCSRVANVIRAQESLLTDEDRDTRTESSRV